MRLYLQIALILMATACGGIEDGSAGETPSTTEGLLPTPSSQPADQERDMGLVDQAVTDLARRLGVSDEEIEVLNSESVTWPDGSLGCPEPDRMYTQALVEGHRVVLAHADRVYLYHSGGDQPPFLCESDEKDGGYDFVPPPRQDY
jgi:hypothetical protein